MKELLHRLNFVYKKPKHVLGKLDPAKQEEFLSEYAKLRKTKGKNDPVYFADAVHPPHDSITVTAFRLDSTRRLNTLLRGINVTLLTFTV